MGGRKTKREKFISALPPLLQTQKSCFWREVVGCNIRASNRQDPASVQLSFSLSLYLPSVRKRAKGGGSDKRGDEFCFRPARIRIIFGVSLSSVFAPTLNFPFIRQFLPKTTQLDRRRIRLPPIPNPPFLFWKVPFNSDFRLWAPWRDLFAQGSDCLHTMLKEEGQCFLYFFFAHS